MLEASTCACEIANHVIQLVHKFICVDNNSIAKQAVSFVSQTAASLKAKFIAFSQTLSGVTVQDFIA